MLTALSLLAIKHGIVVSSQASGTEPLNRPEILCAMAESSLQGGASGIRMAQMDNLSYFKSRHPETFLIGITKPDPIPDNSEELVYITPDIGSIHAIAPFCNMVAMDATQRPRPDNSSLSQLVTACRQHYPDLYLMADISTLEEGLAASHLGFDCIGTTLSGYTTQSKTKKENMMPDFELLSALVQQCSTPIILEGKIWEPGQVTHGFNLGAYSVVIGSVITRPHHITQRFVTAIPS